MLIVPIFELKSLCLAGFAPEVDGCIQCLKDEIDYINVYDGVCLCEECYGASGGDKMSKAVQKAVRHIVKCDEKKLFSFKLSEQAVSSLSAITEKYVKICMEKEYSSLKYLRNIQKGMR